MRLSARSARRRLARKSRCAVRIDPRLMLTTPVDPTVTVAPDVYGLTSVFTRSSRATFCDGAGKLRTLPAHLPRFHHVDLALAGSWNEVGLLIEQATTNMVRATEDLNNTSYWSKANSITVTAAAKTCGELVLDLLDDASNSVIRYLSQDLSTNFAGSDGRRGVSFFIAQGTSTSTVVRLQTTSGATDRGAVTITWSGGVPQLALSGGAAHGYIERWADGTWRIGFSTATSTAVSVAHTLVVFPANTATGAGANMGTVYIGGFQIENISAPTSYVKTAVATLGTRAAEQLYYDFLAAPQDMSVWWNGMWNSVNSSNGSMWAISNTGFTGTRYYGIGNTSGSVGAVYTHSGGSNNYSANFADPVPRQRLRVIVRFNAALGNTPYVESQQAAGPIRLNEVIGSGSTPPGTAWTTQRLYISSFMPSSLTFGLKVIMGSETVTLLQADVIP